MVFGDFIDDESKGRLNFKWINSKIVKYIINSLSDDKHQFPNNEKKYNALTTNRYTKFREYQTNLMRTNTYFLFNRDHKKDANIEGVIKINEKFTCS